MQSALRFRTTALMVTLSWTHMWSPSDFPGGILASSSETRTAKPTARKCRKTAVTASQCNARIVTVDCNVRLGIRENCTNPFFYTWLPTTAPRRCDSPVISPTRTSHNNRCCRSTLRNCTQYAHARSGRAVGTRPCVLFIKSVDVFCLVLDYFTPRAHAQQGF